MHVFTCSQSLSRGTGLTLHIRVISEFSIYRFLQYTCYFRTNIYGVNGLNSWLRHRPKTEMFSASLNGLVSWKFNKIGDFVQRETK